MFFSLLKSTENQLPSFLIREIIFRFQRIKWLLAILAQNMKNIGEFYFQVFLVLQSASLPYASNIGEALSKTIS